MTVTPLPDLATSELVRRYALGELAGEELSRFEQRLLGEAELQDQVEAELALREHAAVLAGPADSTAGRRARHWTIAASLLAGVGLGWLAARLPTPTMPPQAIEVVSFTVVRGAPGGTLQATAGRPLVARFLTASDQAHRVEVSDRQGGLLLAIPDLRPDAAGDIDVLLPPFPAQPGPLRVRLISPARTDEFELHLR